MLIQFYFMFMFIVQLHYLSCHALSFAMHVHVLFHWLYANVVREELGQPARRVFWVRLPVSGHLGRMVEI